MREVERRVVVEQLKKWKYHLESTSVRRGEEAVWVSTVDHGVSELPIETFVWRTGGVIAEGREGTPDFQSGERMLHPLCWQFEKGQHEQAREYHHKVVDAVASILEDDPSQLDALERYLKN